MAQFSPLNKRRQEEIHPSLVEPRDPEDRSSSPHPMVLEAKLWDSSARSKGRVRNLPQDKAQDLVFQAYETGIDAERKRQLAREALTQSHDCADALLLLADDAESADERLQKLEQAVAAGRRTLGIRTFQEDTGRFWTVVETRPYLRAVERLALALWKEDRREDAIDYMEDLLRLNPNDHQGIRYAIVPRLIEMGRDSDAERFLDRFPEQTASWAYHRSLISYLREGDSSNARDLLLQAMRLNPAISEFLITEAAMPPALDYSQVGLEPEAIVYCRNSLDAWKSTSGALPWARSVFEALRAATKSLDSVPSAPSGPTLASRAKLFKLPQTDEIWEADCRQASLDHLTDDRPSPPWVAIVVVAATGEVRAICAYEREPSSNALWDMLDQAMSGDPGLAQRPASLKIAASSLWSDLEQPLGKIGITCATTDPFDQLEQIYENLIVR